MDGADDTVGEEVGSEARVAAPLGAVPSDEVAVPSKQTHRFQAVRDDD